MTAFEAFGGDEMNPTELVLGRLLGTIGGYGIEKLLLPMEFVRCRELAFAKYDELSPAAVVMLGQAGGRGAVTPETRGKNVMDARMPDNAGYEPENVPIVEGGPETLDSTLPVGRICEAVQALGVPCEPSDDAGGYVCNALLYGMLEHNSGEVPTGFPHVSFVPEQGHVDRPALHLADIEKAVEAAIGAVIRELDGLPSAQ